MCLILTFFAAVLTSFVWYKKDRLNTYKVGTLALMFWGASLMWLVDSMFAVFNGEAFFDISFDDTKLGALIIICGVAMWLIILAISRSKRKLLQAH